MRKKRKKRLNKRLLITLLVIALIILPTGTPEDLFTSVPLIKFLGLRAYILLCLAILFFIYLNGYTFSEIIKMGKRMLKGR